MTSAYQSDQSAQWHKSTYSGQTGDCVEVAENLPDAVLVRDTKDRSRLVLKVQKGAWGGFLDACKSGEFNR